MPKVGKKEFKYTEKGKKEAKAYAEKTGEKVEKYYGGGMVDLPIIPSVDSPIEPRDLSTSPLSPYNVMDARNRSQIYMEYGGKVDKKKK